MLIIFLILVPVALFLGFRKYVNRNSSYWKDRGVFTLENDGNFLTTLVQLLKVQRSPVDDDNDIYRALGNGKYGGRFEFGSPILLIKDLDVVKQILVRDFANFVDRRDFIDSDPLLSKTLFFLHGTEWKEMRAFLSPTFTSGKLRRMFHHFERCSESLKEYVVKHYEPVGDGFNVNVLDIMQRFATDAIGSAAFGMDIDALKKKDSFFFEQSKRAVQISKTRLLKFGLFSFFPKLGNFFKMQMVEPELSDFFFGLLRNAIMTREGNSTEGRNDFLQILVEAKAENKTGVDFSIDIAVQQAFLFLNAGFDAASGALSSFAYILAVYQDVQEKLWQEVRDAAEDGKFSYEKVNSMEYLDMVFSEILRMYPPLSRLERKCTEDYELPGANFSIPKGMIVGIPVESIHYDEKYYPNPTEFIPERFSAENKGNRNSYSYMPFGIGPRNCIGMRFALVEVKVAVCHILLNFQLRPIPGKTLIPIRMWKRFGMTRAPKNLELAFIPRN